MKRSATKHCHSVLVALALALGATACSKRPYARVSADTKHGIAEITVHCDVDGKAPAGLTARIGKRSAPVTARTDASFRIPLAEWGAAGTHKIEAECELSGKVTRASTQLTIASDDLQPAWFEGCKEPPLADKLVVKFESHACAVEDHRRVGIDLGSAPNADIELPDGTTVKTNAEGRVHATLDLAVVVEQLPISLIDKATSAGLSGRSNPLSLKVNAGGQTSSATMSASLGALALDLLQNGASYGLSAKPGIDRCGVLLGSSGDKIISGTSCKTLGDVGVVGTVRALTPRKSGSTCRSDDGTTADIDLSGSALTVVRGSSITPPPSTEIWAEPSWLTGCKILEIGGSVHSAFVEVPDAKMLSWLLAQRSATPASEQLAKAADDRGEMKSTVGKPGSSDRKPSTPQGAQAASQGLPGEVVHRIVRQNFGRMRLCYESGLRTNPDLKGRVAVKFVVDRSGAVSSAADGGSTLPDEKVVGCVVQAFKGLSFPPPEGGRANVLYPVTFNPG